MGLLNQVLGGVLGRSAGNMGLGGLGGGIGRGGGMSSVLMALLPVVLGMIANRGAGSGRVPTPGGGLGARGGLGGLLQQFTQKGYGEQARSWVSTGPNQSLPPEAMRDVLGDDQIASIASEAGVSQDEARQGLSELLPDVVDHFTPQGQLPTDDELEASIEDYGRQLPR